MLQPQNFDQCAHGLQFIKRLHSIHIASEQQQDSKTKQSLDGEDGSVIQ